MPCIACTNRIKDWSGGDPVCSFPNSKFNPIGWNCATAGAIRDLCGQPSRGVEPHINTDYRFCADQNYATIDISEVELPSGYALALWVSWYKNRGRTEAMWLLSDDVPPRLPTEADAVAIIETLTRT